MRIVLILIGAAVVLMVVGAIISALKWLLIIAAVLAVAGLLVGWRPGQRSTYR